MVRWNAVVRGSVYALSLAVAINCSSNNDDDDDDASGGSSGSSGNSGTGGGGTPDAGTGGSAGDPNTGTGGTSGNGPMACTTLTGLGDCGAQTLGSTQERVNLLFVIDKSGSMRDPVAGGVSKWNALNQALQTALPAVQDRVNMGVELFPKKELPNPCEDIGTCCAVPTDAAAVNVGVADGTTTVPQILSELQTTEPGGGTPTADALAAALDYYTNGPGASLEGTKYVVLATDGGPNCNANGSCEGDVDRCTINTDGNCDDQTQSCCDKLREQGNFYCLDESRTLAQITALKEAGISTFVIGIPGTEQYATYLNQFALAGGVPYTDADPNTPDYYAVSAEAGVKGLTDVFVDITTKLIRSCEIPLAEVPPDDEKVNLAIECEVLPKGAANGSGWEYDNEDAPTKIVVKGPACTFIETKGVSQVDVVYGCPTVEIR